MNRKDFMKDCFGVYRGNCTEHPKCMKGISEEGSIKCAYCKCVPTFHEDVMQKASTDITGNMVKCHSEFYIEKQFLFLNQAYM